VPVPLMVFGAPLVGRAIGRRLLANPTRESSRAFWGKLLVAHPERLEDVFLDCDVAHMRRNAESVLGGIGAAAGLGGLRRELVLGDRWRSPRVPTLVVLGERDAFVNGPMRRGIDAMVRDSGAELAWIPDAGHLPWFDQPDRVVEALERFLSKEERRTA
jgi:pimeloyl-ACP methyl ester carboxylesterase